MQFFPYLGGYIRQEISLPVESPAFIPVDELRVQKVIDLVGSNLIWKPDGNFVKKDADEKLVFNFSNLALAEPDEILRFARKWGGLGICEHGLPAPHNPRPVSLSPNLNSECKPSGLEPTEVWNQFARLFRAMLSIGANLRKNMRGNEGDWCFVLQGLQDYNLPSTITEERRLLERILNLLLLMCDVRPQLQLEPANLKMCRSSSSGLFGVLTVQLISGVVRTNGFVICSACGKSGLYEDLRGSRLRAPKAGARFYCGHCQIIEEPMRLARQRHRDRNK